jgi:HAD superfamily hydrolase (TIGR01509 family)
MLRTSDLGWVVAWSVVEGILSTAFSGEPAGQRPDGGVRLPAAVLWDMDGTLVDTEPYWIEVEFELAAEHGGTWSREHALELVGNDLITSGRYIREHMGIDLSPEEIVEALLDGVVGRVQERVPWCPGARELLAELRAAHVPCGLVTMSYTRFVAPILAALPADTFSAIVTGDVVTRGKPDPEPYQMAARMLRVHPADCLAIEDSNTGTVSAVAAGCTVLVVPNHVQVAEGERRVFASSLQGVDLDGLRGLLPTTAPRS